MDSNGISDLYAQIFSGTSGLIALVFDVLVVVGLFVFPYIGYLILGFGEARYSKA